MDHSSDEEINVFGDSSDDDLLVSNEPHQALQVDGHADFRDLLSGQTNRELCKSIEGAQIRFIRSERKQLIMVYEEETGQKRMIIMSSLYMLDKFSQSSSIAGDGTFYSRPVGWRQVYAWHLRLRNTFVPAVVVFMGDRTENTREWNVLHVMTDYEPAIRLAVFKHFGGRVNHLSCYFHFSYCITKKLKKLKLKKKSDREAPFCQFIRQFRILPLLPVNQVMAAFADLTNFTLPHRNQFAEVPRLQEFFDYMRLTWIGGLRRNGEAFSPRFPIRIWNHNSSLMQDNPKTTSVLESWHRTINAELRKRRAHKYWSIHCIVRDELYNCALKKPRPALQGIPVLQRAVNDFDSNQVNMSLARITEAAYSNRWNRPTSLKNGGIAQQQPVAINVPGINQNLANRRRGWFNAPIIQRNALVPYDKPELQDQRIN
uniref:MULE transposase domain-containing protein n=1 Tax=Ditylenchus dipsaci TaxID=166011 RepID=A0A915DEZ9_9BILA